MYAINLGGNLPANRTLASINQRMSVGMLFLISNRIRSDRALQIVRRASEEVKEINCETLLKSHFRPYLRLIISVIMGI